MISETSFDWDGLSLVRDLLIETGTYTGIGTLCGLLAGFPRVITIEHDLHIWADTSHALADLTEWVEFKRGTSPMVLPSVIDGTIPTTFLLSAHYIGLPWCTLWGQCPLLAELKAIFAVSWDYAPVILIDSAHMYQHWHDPACWKWCQPTDCIRADFPTKSEIVTALPSFYSVNEWKDVFYCLPC